MKVSIIIPCYNAVDKIGRCLASLRAIDMERADYEVIFVDDCSTDGTLELLQRNAEREKNWRIERLPMNSGSPSRPRNCGMALAKGEYLFFLDCDDEILPDTLRLHYQHARATNADIVRGYLFADDGRRRIAMNRLGGWKATFSYKQRIAEIVAHQSMGSPSLIRAELLELHKISWREEMKMGEDTLFNAHVLVSSSNVEYIDHPAYVYNKLPSLVASSTQQFGARELRDQLVMWPTLAEILATAGIDYYRLRFHVSLRYILSLIIHRNRGDIDGPLFQEFSEFISKHWPLISQFNYAARYKEILTAVHAGEFMAFRELARPRLVIAGHDLKFITPFIPDLEHFFDVRVDEWSGHESNVEANSRELLEWAELIWCEWLLGNAVWYAANKKPHQRLVIRYHRFELSRDFGAKLRCENVDAVVAVCVHFFERLLERFPDISRAKARLLPIGYRTSGYHRDFSEARLYTISMIGILPSRKGFDKALDILARLRRVDPRYRLEVFGKRPEELRWIATDKAEVAYFGKCRSFIEECGLTDAVTFHGHSDIETALADKRVGFVLSLSQSVREFPGFEAFHVAVGDGYAGGAVSLILSYIGAEYVWPKEFILSSEAAIVERILSFRDDPEGFRAASERGRQFVEDRYSAEAFAMACKGLFTELA